MDSTTEEIRNRADIVEVVGQYVALRPAGNNRFKACCPFHDEKTPSFYVSRDKGFYKCFGCGESGDIFKFLQQVENISFPEAKKLLADRYGVVLRSNKEWTPEQQAAFAERDQERDNLYRVLATAAAFFREQFSGNAGLPARDYARRRGLSAKTIERFGIGYAPDAWDRLLVHLTKKYGFKEEDAAAAGLLIERKSEEEQLGGLWTGTGRIRYYDRYRHRLIFPIWDPQGRVIAFGGRALEGGNTGTPDAKYINSPEGPLFKKSRTLYAWHLARAEVGKQDAVILTEGYMDAIALHEAGFGNTIATLGTALTIDHVKLLRRLAPKIVYLCYDGDSAGMQAALRAAPLFTAHQLDARVVSLPREDDPDTFIRKHGEVGFQNALRNAKLLAQYRMEMAIEGFDLGNVVERAQAIKAAADIVAEIPPGTEREGYIAWLADRWANAEGITSSERLQMVQVAVRREVDSAKRRWSAQSPGQSTTARQQAEEEKQEVKQTLSETAGGQLSGVGKAERSLLCVLLNSPSWRRRILEKLPLEQWTQETHGEIAAVLSRVEGDDPINPTELLEKLSDEAAGLVSELMLADEAQTAAEARVIEDWIARIKGHWAKQTEREILELVKGKLQRGELVTDEERAAYQAALLQTKRKTAPPPASDETQPGL
ncbi:MAG: DNA primase [Armatimonadota bacterium]|nr:DNA primase [Armatimonadota bacterium]